mgnify:CR=1 FL=1
MGILFALQFPHDLFGGREVFLFVVAGFAAGHAVALGACAAADHRDDVVHGQFFRGEALPAIMADAPGKLLPPPFALAQFLRLGALARDVPGVFLDIDPVRHGLSRVQGLKVAPPSARINPKRQFPSWLPSPEKQPEGWTTNGQFHSFRRL